MKFVHTADWQIGMKAAQVGAAAERVREERFAAGARVVELAIERAVDFLLVAGDTFEDNAVDRVAVRRVAEILGRFPGPVYIIPGNHDPPVAGSVWDHGAWDEHPQLRVFRVPDVIELPDGRLFACPLREKHSPHDPTRSIEPDTSRSTIRIGLSHGTVEGIADDAVDYPISPGVCQARGLDYLALGHWHSTATFADGRVVYAGSPETTKFGERDSGNALVVSIDTPGAAPTIEVCRTGGLSWQVIERIVTQPRDLLDVAQAVDKIADPGATLLAVRLSGVISASDSPTLERIDEILQSRFLWGSLDASRLVPEPSDESWLAELPSGPIREAAARLAASAHASAREQGDAQTAAVSTQALRELYALRTEVGA
ncbi:MAG: DNA repair exonuclease [Planctomycetales bacterium]|nr:DNA repair exonuclease [Planctomycetales bacterium]